MLYEDRKIHISFSFNLMKTSYTRRLKRLTRWIFISLEKPIVALLSIVTLSCSTVAPTSQIPMVSGAKNAQVQQGLHPDYIADPFEPWNRMVWAANQGLLVGFLHPTARAYRAICPPPIRGSIRNFARNLAYPGRLLNNIFQGTVNGKLCRKLAKLSKNLILQLKGLIVTFLEIQKFCSCKLVACT